MFEIFPREVTVTYIDHVSWQQLAESKLKSNRLVSQLITRKTLELQGRQWSVVRAEPESRSEIRKIRALTIWVKQVPPAPPGIQQFPVPSIAAEIPVSSSLRPFEEFNLTIHPNEWRQIEFLPSGSRQMIQEEMAPISRILEADSRGGFPDIHVRTLIGKELLNINWDDFIRDLGTVSRGSVSFQNTSGYLRNGFALRCGNLLFYGIKKNEQIAELCLSYLTDEENISAYLQERYNLILVSWCDSRIIGS